MSNSQHRFRPYAIRNDEDLVETNVHAEEGEVERVNAMRIFQLTATQLDMLAPTRIVSILGRVRAKCKFYRLVDIQALVARGTGAQDGEYQARLPPYESSDTTDKAPASINAGKRTKQTARKSTGGLAPRSPLHRPEPNVPRSPVSSASSPSKRTRQTARKTTGSKQPPLPKIPASVSGPLQDEPAERSVSGSSSIPGQRARQTARKSTGRRPPSSGGYDIGKSPKKATGQAIETPRMHKFTERYIRETSAEASIPHPDTTLAQSDTTFRHIQTSASSRTGFRTKQTARKSTGGRPPRSPAHH